MEIFGIYNIKGGVGKTTTAVNLAYRSAADGWRTLLWDLDPQAAATYILGRNEGLDGDVRGIMRGETEAASLVQSTDYPNLDLLPAASHGDDMEGAFRARNKPVRQLVKLMAPLHRRYACLVMDCAPGMSIVSENVLHAADALIVPLMPSPLSVRTLRQLKDFLIERQWGDLLVLPFFSMIDRRRNLHKETAAALREEFPEILTTEVPYGAAFEQAAVRRAPVEAFAPRSAAADVYRALWREIDERLQSRAEGRLDRQPGGLG